MAIVRADIRYLVQSRPRLQSRMISRVPGGAVHDLPADLRAELTGRGGRRNRLTSTSEAGIDAPGDDRIPVVRWAVGMGADLLRGQDVGVEVGQVFGVVAASRVALPI